MDQLDVLQVAIGSVDQIDAAFEFWITISFGVMIAIHVLRGSIQWPMKVLICVLYFTASLIAIFSTVGDIAFVRSLQKYIELQDLGGQPWDAITTLLRFTLYTLGTITISIAIFRYDKWIDQRDT
jgi:hypothetical protein